MGFINPTQSNVSSELARLRQSSHSSNEPSTTVTDQLAKEQGDSMSPSDRKVYFSEKNQVDQLRCRNLLNESSMPLSVDSFKENAKIDAQHKARQLENYKQQFDDNQAKQKEEAPRLAELLDQLEDVLPQIREKSPSMLPKLAEPMKDFLPPSSAYSPDASSAGKAAAKGAENKSQSSKEFCEEIAKGIANIKNGHLDVYSDALNKYLSFFQRVSKLLAKLAEFISDGKDNKVKIEKGKLKTELDNLLKAMIPRSEHQLFPTDSTKSATKDQAADWAKKFGLPDSCVVEAPGGGWYVKIDTSPIDDMLRGLSGLDSGEISSAKYQAWKAGFDANVEKIQNLVQTLSQKYTSANSTYDNVVKVLSSTITSMYDADKEFLKN